MLIIDIAGIILTAQDKRLIRHPLISGIILFTRNYHSLVQLKNLTSAIRQTASASLKPNFIISVDQEGGRVQRFKKDFSALPAMAEMGKLYDDDFPEKALANTQEIGRIIGKELKAAGLNACFAPVLDIDQGLSKVIGSRSFHHDPYIAALLGYALLSGMNSEGVSGVGKHFPGHGGVTADSHNNIPVDNRSFEEINQTDLSAFKYFIQNINLNPYALLTGIMPAHIIYSACDSKPAGFSEFWLKQILRRQLNFQGTVFSDDLCMTGASVMGSIVERVTQAKKAGCDILLICNNRPAVIEAIEAIEDSKNESDKHASIANSSSL